MKIETENQPAEVLTSSSNAKPRPQTPDDHNIAIEICVFFFCLRDIAVWFAYNMW
jgi:hypothetical protein